MIWNPWRRIRELEARIDDLSSKYAGLTQALHLATDRYDKVREMNLQLRDALTIYRNVAK